METGIITGLVASICIEACLARRDLRVVTIAYYAVQVAFLQENLRRCCHGSLDGVHGPVGITRCW